MSTATTSNSAIDVAEHHGRVLQNQALVISIAKDLQKFGAVRRMGFDDAVQEGFVALTRCGRDFKEEHGAKFGTYAYLSIRRRILNQALARKSRLAGIPFEEGAENQVPAPDQADAVEREDVAAWLRQAVQKLSPRYWTIVRLYFGLNGQQPLDLQQIARVVHRSKQRVHQLLRAALLHLRRMAEESGIRADG